MATRDTDWLEGWLEKYNGDSPQPYRQLAKVLRQMGHEDKAADVLYASRERELRKATGINWLWLTSLKYIIGYGYGYHIWQAGLWVLFWWSIGTGVLLLWKEEANKKMPEGVVSGFLFGLDYIFYSLYRLLPFMRLDRRYDDTPLTDIVRYYFYLHQLVGYVLALFLIAGLTGLTK